MRLLKCWAQDVVGFVRMRSANVLTVTEIFDAWVKVIFLFLLFMFFCFKYVLAITHFTFDRVIRVQKDCDISHFRSMTTWPLHSAKIEPQEVVQLPL